MSRSGKKTKATSAESNLVVFPELEESVPHRLTTAFPHSEADFNILTSVAYKRALFLHAVYELRGEYGNEHSCENLNEEEYEQLKPLIDAIWDCDWEDYDSYPADDEDSATDDTDASEPEWDIEFTSSIDVYCYGEICRSLQIPYQPLHEYVLYGSVDDGVSSSFGYDELMPSVRLAIEALDISEADTFLDVDCESAEALAWVAREKKPAQLYGLTNGSFGECLGLLRSTLFDNMHVGAYGKQTLTGLCTSSYSFERIPVGTKADKVFAICLNLDWVLEEQSVVLAKGVKAANSHHKSPLTFLADGGTLACLVPNSALTLQVRQHLVEGKMLKGVISLPAGLDGGCYKGVAKSHLIIISHNSGNVRFVDACDLYESNWRDLYEVSDEDVRMAYLRYRDGGFNTVDVAPADIAKAGWSLSPCRHVAKGRIAESLVPLGDLSLSISRGANLSASGLDEMATLDDTGFRYVRLSDMEDGRLHQSLPPINPIADNLRKYCLEEGDLLISKSGAPFKIAVARVPEGQTLLATGNLYIVRLDRSRILPSYAAAYLQSEPGIRLLESACSGAKTPVIALKALKSIPVPMLSLAEQQKMSDRYEAKLDELEITKKRIARIRGDLKKLFSAAI